jgi:hypothetical protein
VKTSGTALVTSPMEAMSLVLAGVGIAYVAEPVARPYLSGNLLASWGSLFSGSPGTWDRDDVRRWSARTWYLCSQLQERPLFRPFAWTLSLGTLPICALAPKFSCLRVIEPVLKAVPRTTSGQVQDTAGTTSDTLRQASGS